MTDKKTRIVSNLFIVGTRRRDRRRGLCDQRADNAWRDERIEMEAPSEDVGGGVIFNKPEGNGMQLTATKLLSSEYAENGVSPLAETAYHLDSDDHAVGRDE